MLDAKDVGINHVLASAVKMFVNDKLDFHYQMQDGTIVSVKRSNLVEYKNYQAALLDYTYNTNWERSVKRHERYGREYRKIKVNT